MQVTETMSQGLKRELKVIVGKDELAEKFNSRLETFRSEANLKGFHASSVFEAFVGRVEVRWAPVRLEVER